MNDDQLSRELGRRANSVSLDAEWAQRELLPYVNSGIAARPTSARASRLPALAGLAVFGAAAIAAIAVLVVALPRVGPGASATVMTAQDFASRFLADQLNGHTVVVDGHILPYDLPENIYTYGNPVCNGEPVADEPGPLPCTLGRLDGVDRSVWVEGTYIQTSPEAWQSAVPPIQGLLVLRVTEFGWIELLGTLKEQTGNSISPEEASGLDISTLSGEDVLLVKGWLISPDGPGTSIAVSCAKPPPFTPVPGLPNEYCQPNDSIASDRIASGRGNFPAGPHLAVQRSAAETFGVTGEEPATYAIAPRLHALCQTAAPCWEWEVIARITDRAEFDGQPVPTSPPTPNGPTERPTSQPEQKMFACEGDGHPVSLTDLTGLVVTCLAVTDVDSRIESSALVTNPNGDPSTLRLLWRTNGCAGPASAEFGATASEFGIATYVLRVVEGAPDASCDRFSPSVGGVELKLRTSIRSTAVSVVRTSPSQPSPFPVFIECGVGAMLIRDSTGLAERCVGWDPPVGASGVTPGGDASSARIAWTYSYCQGAPYARFEYDGERYWAELSFFVNAISVLPSCEPVTRTVGVEIHFSQPIDIGLISAPSYGDSPRPQPTIDVASLRLQADAALRRWDDAVREAGGQGIVFTQGITGQSGNWEDDVGENHKGALYAGLIEAIVPLSAAPPSPSDVRWSDGTSTEVQLLSALDGLRELSEHATDTCADCRPLRVTGAALGTAEFETSRGTAEVPVWRYTLADSNVKVIQVAAANAISLIPPPWDPYNTPRGESIISARGNSEGRELIVSTGYEVSPSDRASCTDFTAEAVESDSAVVVIITAFDQTDSGTTLLPGDISDAPCGLVTLASPLGERTVLEVREGLPVPVLPL